MSNQPPAKSPKKKPTPASKTSSTDENPPEFDAVLAMETLRRTLENQGTLAEQLKGVTDFHAAVEDARDDDLRLFWDVRLVRGKDEPFASVSGSSSLPSILAPKLCANAPALVQQEILDKIAQPLTAVLMDDGEEEAIQRAQRIETKGDPAIGMIPPAGNGKDILDIAAGVDPAPEIEVEIEKVTEGGKDD